MSESRETMACALRAAAQKLMARHSIRDPDLLLSRIVAAAVETVPGAEAGGVSMMSDGQLVSRCSTSAGARRFVALQHDLSEGPCVTALEHPASDGVVVAHDLADADGERWPELAPRAVAQGFRASMAVQLPGELAAPTVLSLHASAPGCSTATPA